MRKYLQFCAVPWNPDPHYLPRTWYKKHWRGFWSATAPSAVRDQGSVRQRRLWLWRAIIHDPELVLLDDPVKVPNEPERQTMVEIVQSLRAAGKTVVVASQHVELYRPIATHGLFLAPVERCTPVPSCGVARRVRCAFARVELFLGIDEADGPSNTFAHKTGVLFAEPADDSIRNHPRRRGRDVTKLIKEVSEHGFPVITFQERAGAF